MTQISDICDRYTHAVFNTDQDTAQDTIYQALNEGLLAEELVFNVILPSLENMLETLVQNDNATLSQHFIAAKVSSAMVEMLLPKFSGTAHANGVVVIGTARGDFHGLGKKIVSGCLTANLFTVYDVGLNVQPERFVQEALQKNASVIAVSSMMMHTAIGDDGPKRIKKLLQDRQLTDRIKLIVGGAPYRFDDKLYRDVNADATALDALSSVAVFKHLVQEVRHA
ncbi:MAG: cobalamin-dependent protein [Deltaproteobacteria bacterium]|nr:cobalamin-dependent protein [Deltaproteobacteria bacterium]MBN2670312.1 cobalamin-dependent protein [Deltaproteobacteria bacterium]